MRDRREPYALFYIGFLGTWTVEIACVDGEDLVTCNIRCGSFMGGKKLFVICIFTIIEGYFGKIRVAYWRLGTRAAMTRWLPTIKRCVVLTHKVASHCVICTS